MFSTWTPEGNAREVRELGTGVLQGRHGLRPGELGHGGKWDVEGGLSYQPADTE